MDLIEYAKNEFKTAGWCDENGNFDCEMQEAICKHVLDLIKVFSEEGHSGSTAPYALGLFNKLAQFKPITPLTGADNEWVRIGGNKFQNTRNSAVFKDSKKGRPYYIHAWTMAWENDMTNCWQGSISLDTGEWVTRAYIKDFANMPTIKIPIPTVHGEKPHDWEFLPINKGKLSELERYYDLEIISRQKSNDLFQ